MSVDDPAPAGTPTSAAGPTVVITTGSGANFRVAVKFEENFRGFLKDFEAAGGKIDPATSGGLSTRPSNASYHPLGRAIDINQTDRNTITSGLPAGKAAEEALAHKWGLRPGSVFSNPDRGHYEANSTANALAALGGVPTPTPIPGGRPELKLGSTGEDVKTVQRIVLADGFYGPVTEQGVKDFQTAHGLTADGIVGSSTWAALVGAPGPIPVPTPVPTPAGDWHTAITATEFGGASDPNKSAYDNHTITDSEMAVALPYHFTGTRPKVEVKGPNGTATGTIEDIGPWNVNDPYWETPGKRPQAESGRDNTGRTTNLAGIDLTPAMAKAVGIDGKGKVDWRFAVVPTPVPALPPAPIPAPIIPTPAPIPVPLAKSGGPMTQEQFLSMVRWLLAVGGPFLIAHGYAADSTVAQIGGAIITMTPLIWSMVVKTTSGLISTAASLPEVKQIITTPAIADGTLKSDPKVLTAPQALAQAAADRGTMS